MKNRLTTALLLILATLILFGSGITDTFANFDVADSDDPSGAPVDPGNQDTPKRPSPKLPSWFSFIFFWWVW